MKKLIFTCLLFSYAISFSYDYFAAVETNISTEEMLPYIKSFHLIKDNWLQFGNPNDKIKLSKNSNITPNKINELGKNFIKVCGSNFFINNSNNIDYQINFYTFDKQSKNKYFLISIYYTKPTNPTFIIQFKITFTETTPEVHTVDIIDKSKAKIFPTDELKKLLEHLRKNPN